MIRKTSFSYRKAHQIIWKHGYWHYLLAPIGLSALLFFVLIGICLLLSTFVSGWAHDLLEKVYDFPDWFQAFWLIGFFLVGLGTCYVAFRSLVMVCYGPFLEKLSIKAEEMVQGQSHEVPRSIGEMIKRPLLMALFTIGASLLALVCGFLLSLVPVVGVAISAALIFPIQIFLATIGFIDPYLDRSGYKAGESIRLMRRGFCGVFGFGLVGTGITLIPFIGWFVGPTYCAVAGIVYAILLTQQDPTFPNREAS